MAARASSILKICEKEKVQFLRLQFTDILGAIKNVEVPKAQFPKALDGKVMFDGSSIEGFVRIEESDMLLVPDLETFRVFSWMRAEGKVARVICDIHRPNGDEFVGCPRLTLKRAAARAKKLGYSMMAGPEAEFFILAVDASGRPTLDTHDAASYFDMAPMDRGEECRQKIIHALQALGFEVEAGHHEVAPGQHEIDFRYAEAVQTADNISTFRLVVKKIASDMGLHATFMPKPLFGQNGSGMHTHQSLFKGQKNAFYSPRSKWQLSATALHYIGGLLRHARAFCAVTNPTVNSYKRLVPGYEAPTTVAWSEKNRSPLIRVPDRRGAGTRCELRMPDPSCNPYLALTVMLTAGLDGIANRTDPGPPVNKNVYKMSQRERRRLRVDELPANLYAAIQEFKKSRVLQEALGEHISEHFILAKEAVWREYIAQVHPWEHERYLMRY
ncbi:MAG: glutamine synthetase family protein [Acidobacteriota bacterium]